MTAVIVRGIDNVLFTVGDLDTAVEFYAGRLGLPLAFRMDEPGVALFRLGDEPPGLLVRRGPVTAKGEGLQRLWLEVTDARATANALAGAGLTTLAEPFSVSTRLDG